MDIFYTIGGESSRSISLDWEVTATNSLISHNDKSPFFSINPNENYQNVQIGIQTKNRCGCSDWKWKVFSVKGATGGVIGGIIIPY